MNVELTNPIAMLLLGLIPVALYFTRHSLANLSGLRGAVSVAVRVMLLLLLVLALGGLRLRTSSRDLALIFVVDLSASTSPDDQREVVDFINQEIDLEVVAQAANGLEGVEAFERHRPDVVLLDLRMPVMEGVEAIRRIRELDAQAKVIILTVHEDQDFVQAGFDAGASGYVVKSRMATDLRQAARAVLAGNTFISALVQNEAKPVG